jgi:hypothetical protein
MGPEIARSGGEEKHRCPWRESNSIYSVRFQVLTAASMKFRFVFWDVSYCSVKQLSTDVSDVGAASIIIALMMEASRTSETSVDNYFTRQYITEDKSELDLF